jgi:4-aminobutyrate aminotransferase-like enzyme/Ser/Thr protein kinase RdoA (MazF antagonist)
MIAEASPLPSERDQNFLLQTEEGERFVLKIANHRESRAILELENQAMSKVAAAMAPDDACPRPIESLEGRDLIELGKHHLRLLNYVPGRPLGDFKPQGPELLRGLGRYLARMDQALASLPGPGARDLPWDMCQAGQVLAAGCGSTTPARAGLLEYFIEAQQSIAAQLAALPRQLIHNDANDYNVMVGGDPANPRVTGLIDFGDMVESPRLVDLAVACAYVMLGKRDPLAAAACVVQGYHAVDALSDEELSLLFPASCTRLAMSVCVGARQIAEEPGNEYLRISQDGAWQVLEQLREVSPKLAEYQLRSACGLDACPQSKELEDWLRKRAGSFAAVVAHSSDQAALVLDLSIASPELSAEEDTSDVDLFSRLIERRMQDAGCDLALGRYAEHRGLYRSEGFAGEGNDFPERRSLHLGVDLFMPAGTPVHAPLAGRVHSLQENPADLDYGPTIILEHDRDDDAPFYTLYGHLSRESLAGLEPGDSVEKGQQIAWMGAPPINGNWPPHLHFQIMVEMLGKVGDFPGVARPSESGVWLSLCPDPNLILGYENLRPAPVPDMPGLRERREKLLGPSLSLSYRSPLHMVRGLGANLYDSRGQAYLDLVNNVCHVGHCHPRVLAAAREQMGVLNTNTRYLHEKILDYAEQLTAKLPDPLSVAFLVCSGSEANELALRMARCHSGSNELLVLDGAYHGNTQALVDASPYKHDGPGGRGRPDWVHKLAMPDPYRGRHRGEDSASAYLQEAREVLASIKTADRRPAALIAEPLLGCGGQLVPPPGYLSGLFAEVRSAGGVCIADEVQVGFGRVGTEFWAFETQDVVPDIVTLGKPIGNGHPLGAVVTTREIAESFANGMEYFNTFGGNPVSASIGLAVLAVIEEEGLQSHAERVGEVLKQGLSALSSDFPLIGDVRGQGLFLGAELVLSREGREPAPRHASHLVERLREKGILLSTDGPDHNVLKFKPPMVISEAEVQRVLTEMASILAEDALQLD